MAEYVLLIYGDERAIWEGGEPVQDQLHEGHRYFHEKHDGITLGGKPLMPSFAAKSVRPTGDTATVDDGPFVQAKEAVIGFYHVEAKDLDDAISIAKDIPAPFGGVEVREVRVFQPPES